MEYIDAEKLIAKIERLRKELPDSIEHLNGEERGFARGQQYELTAIEEEILRIQQEQPRKRLIQVKCLYPYDESWQENKVYTCEVWHHGYLNRDFWDVYYDYGNNPKYVQFSSIQMLNEEFAIVKQEQPKVDLDAIVNETFDKYSSVDGYGQLVASFNRAELYSFVKEITRKED
jgi:hypothetical protein